MKNQVLFSLVLAAALLAVQAGGHRVWRRPGRGRTTLPPDTESATGDSEEAPAATSSKALLSSRALGLWPPSLLTFLNRAGPWSMSMFRVYFLYLGDVNQLIAFARGPNSAAPVRKRCPLVLSYCNTDIRQAASSSDLLVSIFARSVSNICCGTSYLIPPSTTATTIAPSGCVVSGIRYQEGQAIPNLYPCTSCLCQGRQARCYPMNCPPLNCPNAVKNPGECCAVCPVTTPAPTTIAPSGCVVSGIRYQEGQAIPNLYPCTSCLCQAGRVRCYPVNCPSLNCANPVKNPGECCAVCPVTTPAPTTIVPSGCVVSGIRYQEGQAIANLYPCSNCLCQGGRVRCYPVNCPSLNCANPVQNPGECCAVCPARCLLSGATYNEGDTIPTTNPCMSCTCQSGQARCLTQSCPPPPCSNPVYRQGQCCPVCPDTTTTPATPRCAELSVQPRIVGGVSARQCEFPSLVGLYRNGAFICGGSILDSRRVMTAAHCVQLAGSFEVHAGKYYTSKATDQQLNPNLQISHVTRTVTHPNFISRRLINDVAILHLESPLNLTSCVLPTCLPPAKAYDFSASCVVAGWGTTRYGGTTAQSLRKVVLPGYSTRGCLNAFSATYTANVVDGVICAALPAGGKDACQGDSGGIMLCRSQDGSYDQYGVVSSGIGCASPAHPGLYTDVAHFLDFIANN